MKFWRFFPKSGSKLSGLLLETNVFFSFSKRQFTTSRQIVILDSFGEVYDKCNLLFHSRVKCLEMIPYFRSNFP